MHLGYTPSKKTQSLSGRQGCNNEFGLWSAGFLPGSLRSRESGFQSFASSVTSVCSKIQHVHHPPPMGSNSEASRMAAAQNLPKASSTLGWQPLGPPPPPMVNGSRIFGSGFQTPNLVDGNQGFYQVFLKS